MRDLKKPNKSDPPRTQKQSHPNNQAYRTRTDKENTTKHPKVHNQGSLQQLTATQTRPQQEKKPPASSTKAVAAHRYPASSTKS